MARRFAVGIKNKIEPPASIDADPYELEGEVKQSIKNTPGSLGEVLTALENDHAFLLEGDVFTNDVIEMWVEMKRTKVIPAVRLRPHPYEFFLYYDT